MNLADEIRLACTSLDTLAERHEAQAVSEEAIALASRLHKLLDGTLRRYLSNAMSPDDAEKLAATLAPYRRGTELLALSRAELVDLALALAGLPEAGANSPPSAMGTKRPGKRGTRNNPSHPQ